MAHEMPQQETETDPGNRMTSSQRYMDTLVTGLADKPSKQSKSPGLFSKVEEKRCEPFEGRAGTSGSSPQEESHKIVESFDWRIHALIEECEKLRLQKESAEEQVKYAEERAKCAEERAEYAEDQAKYAEERAKYAEERAKYAEGRVGENQVTESKLGSRIRELWDQLKELKRELSLAQSNLKLKDKNLQDVKEKLKRAEEKVNELELEKGTLLTKLEIKKEERSSPGRSSKSNKLKSNGCLPEYDCCYLFWALLVY